MKFASTIIIGGGQCGLAMSRHLNTRSIDHVILERGEVANSWNTERWKSLRLLTPNWQTRLPGFAYDGPDPDGFMTMPEVVTFLTDYAKASSAPVLTGVNVTRVRRIAKGYEISTDQDTWRCWTLVIATGACNTPLVPSVRAAMSPRLMHITPMRYREPSALPSGAVLVVGASATGVQLARELNASGRPVLLCVGEHVRMPRMYRGRDIQRWMDVTGAMDVGHDAVDDIERARRLPSPQLVGTKEHQLIDLNLLQKEGIEVVGRLVRASHEEVHFSGSLANLCALADLKMNRLLGSIDAWIEANGPAPGIPPSYRFQPTMTSANPRLRMNLHAHGIETVLWATGYRPDYSWLDVPVLDRKGFLRHEGGVAPAPGMYVLGLPFMRRRKSSFIDGAGDDAADIADHLCRHLSSAAA